MKKAHMTNEEAIEYLDKLSQQAFLLEEYGDVKDSRPIEEAIAMAIKALRRERA